MACSNDYTVCTEATWISWCNSKRLLKQLKMFLGFIWTTDTCSIRQAIAGKKEPDLTHTHTHALTRVRTHTHIFSRKVISLFNQNWITFLLLKYYFLSRAQTSNQIFLKTPTKNSVRPDLSRLAIFVRFGLVYLISDRIQGPLSWCPGAWLIQKHDLWQQFRCWKNRNNFLFFLFFYFLAGRLPRGPLRKNIRR